jgi:hypothetical protein
LFKVSESLGGERQIKKKCRLSKSATLVPIPHDQGQVRGLPFIEGRSCLGGGSSKAIETNARVTTIASNSLREVREEAAREETGERTKLPSGSPVHSRGAVDTRGIGEKGAFL